MVLAGAATSSGTVYVLIAILSGLCLIIGYLSNWLSPFARKHKVRVDRLDNMLAGWEGIPSRPGFDIVPSVPERLKSVEDKLDIRIDREAVIEENIAQLNSKVRDLQESRLIPTINKVENIDGRLAILERLLGAQFVPVQRESGATPNV